MKNIKLILSKLNYQVNEPFSLTIINNSTSVVSFGWNVLIEQYKNGRWREYPLEMFFIMELILIQPGQVFKQDLPLEGLGPGRYRVTKQILLKECKKSCLVQAEFTILPK